jgi:hypothetical protein
MEQYGRTHYQKRSGAACPRMRRNAAPASPGFVITLPHMGMD